MESIDYIMEQKFDVLKLEYTSENEKYIFVLYLAVNDQIRSKGQGSQILQEKRIEFYQKFLPKTANPEHMKSNAEVDFEISAEDMELLKHFKKIESYGKSSCFLVYGGKM